MSTGGGAPQALYAPDPATVLLIGPRGVSRSTDGGQTFSAVAGAVSGAQLSATRSAGGAAVVAWGSPTLLRSTDAGATWTRLALPFRPSRLLDADFLDTAQGYGLDAQHRLWLTQSAGRHWREIKSLGSGAGQQLAFNSIAQGFVRLARFGSSGAGWVLHTVDGGVTWHPQLVGATSLTDLQATSSGIAYALAGPAELMATNSGGDAGKVVRLVLRPVRALRGRGSVTVAGVLTRASGGEQVLVSWRRARGLGWQQRTASAGSGGAFSLSLPLRAGDVVVAQWGGDESRSGAGSPAVTVAAAPRPRRRRR